MRKFLEYVAKCLVDKPEDVNIEETDENGRTKFKLFVNSAETGKVIGKEGKTAKAIRTLLTAVSAKEGKRCSLEIPDKHTQKT